MNSLTLNALIAAGDVAGLTDALAKADVKTLNTPDLDGKTPLMRAASRASGGAEMVRALIAHGARFVQSENEMRPDPLRCALGAGDPETVAALVAAGGDLKYRTHKGYDALLDAVHGRDVTHDARLIALLAMLLAAGVAADGRSDYGESGVRVLSRLGRFDGVALLLKAGAPRDQLAWSALHEAVALGDLDDVAAFASGDDLAAIDDWGRTPFLLAIVIGDVAKARCLAEHGADIAALGRGGETALHMAAERRRAEAMAYLLGEGMDVNAGDYYGRTPLQLAVEAGDAAACAALIAHGADVNRGERGALAYARAGDVARVLLGAGADAQMLTSEGARTLCGLTPEEDLGALAQITDAMFARDGARRFGTANPQPMAEPYFAAMVRSGVSAYRARRAFESLGVASPVWCARRFGQSLTILPDGRIVQIGGEHEDSYDPEFCIYNDVFAHDGVGGVRVFGYPKSIFPPTDFHTATLVGDAIYVIGSLGYKDERQYGRTPVYRLDLNTWSFSVVAARGDAPGWIYRHQARLSAPGEIEISGGEVLRAPDNRAANMDVFVLDLAQGQWRKGR